MLDWTMTKKTNPSRRFYLREVRRRAGLTQEQLAELCGTTKGVISQLETGHTRYHEDWIEKLAEALSITPAVLLTEPSEKPDASLQRLLKTWVDIPARQREALAALAESFRENQPDEKGLQIYNSV